MPPGGDVSRPIRLVLADEYPIVRAGIAAVIAAESDMLVLADAADGTALLKLVRHHRPDIVIIDPSMPGVSGAEGIERISQECPETRVLIFTGNENSPQASQLLRAGADGYVVKRASGVDLVRAVRAVASGGTYIDPSVAGSLVRGPITGDGADQRGDDGLSDRERQVVMRVARGFSNKEIAARLGLSVKTVETYKARVAEKAGLRTRVDIVRYAVERGWLGDETNLTER